MKKTEFVMNLTLELDPDKAHNNLEFIKKYITDTLDGFLSNYHIILVNDEGNYLIHFNTKLDSGELAIRLYYLFKHTKFGKVYFTLKNWDASYDDEVN